MKTCAFLSYQTADKLVARQIQDVLDKVGIDSFLAHEDIAVSEEWRLRILEEIGEAEIFICLLSKNYLRSCWCMQESGIAAFRQGMSIIPLSLDGTIPQGFISNFQAVKVDPGRITLSDLIPGLLRHDKESGINVLIELIKRSDSYRAAERNFEMIVPYISQMTDAQVKKLLETSADNCHVHEAARCARDYLPLVLKSHGHLLSRSTRLFLKNACARYS